MNILDLPKELHLEILEYLTDIPSQIILTQVCPLWKEIITNSKYFIDKRYTWLTPSIGIHNIFNEPKPYTKQCGREKLGCRVLVETDEIESYIYRFNDTISSNKPGGKAIPPPLRLSATEFPFLDEPLLRVDGLHPDSFQTTPLWTPRYIPTPTGTDVSEKYFPPPQLSQQSSKNDIETKHACRGLIENIHHISLCTCPTCDPQKIHIAKQFPTRGNPLIPARLTTVRELIERVTGKEVISYPPHSVLNARASASDTGYYRDYRFGGFYTELYVSYIWRRGPNTEGSHAYANPLWGYIDDGVHGSHSGPMKGCRWSLEASCYGPCKESKKEEEGDEI
ncbi:hypothetical protein TWF281_009761 [Arthrobotrys megalospora]